MEKPAPTDLPIHDLIRRRYSPRAFSERTIADQDLDVLFEAARWAPSCYNEQPWRFIVANRTDSDGFARMLACIVPGNTPWAQHAAVLCIGVTATTFRKNGKPNRHAWYDLGGAVQTLTVQATSMDLFLHPMAGFDPDKARATYAIPEGYDPAVAIAIGYRGDADALPEPYRKLEHAARERLPLDTIRFSGTWPEP